MKVWRLFDIPEILLSFLSFFLNFFWEVVHTYFYTLKDSEFNTMLYGWLHCSLVDVMITIGCFWLVSLMRWDRRWYLASKRMSFIGFITAGVVYTGFSEWANVHIVRSWAYNESMPVIPLINVGLTPVLQWIVIPSVIILLLRAISQLAGNSTRSQIP